MAFKVTPNYIPNRISWKQTVVVPACAATDSTKVTAPAHELSDSLGFFFFFLHLVHRAACIHLQCRGEIRAHID